MVKDGEPWLPAFLRHHEQLGAAHTVLLDNGSEDATVEIATSRDRVSVFRTGLPFATYNVPLKRWLVKRFGGEAWRLYCDVDELFEYPFQEELPLSSFLRYLNRHGYDGVAAQLLDMFPAEPLGEIQGRRELDLKRAYPFFDIAHVEKTTDKYWLRMNELGSEDLRFHRGGVRARVFGATGAMLTKHPLLRPGRSGGRLRVFPYDDHFVTGARLADVSGVLRHYTFTASFLSQIRSYTGAGARFNTSHVYERYGRVWSETGDLRLRGPTAERYESARDLLDRGFLVASEGFRAWAEGASGAASEGRTPGARGRAGAEAERSLTPGRG